MKKNLMIVLLMCSTLLCNAQETCKILYLNTETINIGGKLHKVGDLFTTQSKINWDTNRKQVMKFCYENCTKQRVVSSDAFKQTKSNSISDYLFSRGQLSSRAGALNSVIELKRYFSRTLGLIDSIGISIGKAFAMDKNHYFYISYIKNNELINKKLTHQGNRLIIDMSVFTVDGKVFPPEKTKASLYYYNAEK
ncbi:MAG: hypothetical protein LBS52_08820, partial [Dysgonamonadaceae bacterium]|nr:hypothetical protein [Dysgonamonadaceae bacterium]